MLEIHLDEKHILIMFVVVDADGQKKEYQQSAVTKRALQNGSVPSLSLAASIEAHRFWETAVQMGFLD